LSIAKLLLMSENPCQAREPQRSRNMRFNRDSIQTFIQEFIRSRNDFCSACARGEDKGGVPVCGDCRFRAPDNFFEIFKHAFEATGAIPDDLGDEGRDMNWNIETREAFRDQCIEAAGFFFSLACQEHAAIQDLRRLVARATLRILPDVPKMGFEQAKGHLALASSQGSDEFDQRIGW
jgi:hypothetical protein